MNFGRLSADNEIIAVRAAGIHLMRLVWPVLAGGVLLTGLALYFQFELNPRAHSAINALRYDAFKQVLLDRVALSGKRELFFRGDTSIHIQYEDFVNGRMINLLVVEAESWSRHPRRIITAASASVHTDPLSAGNILFDMTDCVITQFGLRQYGEADTFVAQEATLAPPMGGGPADDVDDDKYLPTFGLVNRVWLLRQQVAREEKALELGGLLPAAERRRDPGQIRTRQRGVLRNIALEVEDLNKKLAPLQEDLTKYGEREPARLRQAIDQGRERLDRISADLKGLKDQQATLLQEVSRMRLQEGGLVDYTHLADLLNRQKLMQDQIDTQEQERAKLDADTTQAQRELTADTDRAGRLRDQVSVLELRRQKVAAARSKPMAIAQWADDLDELNSLMIRIHKRLVEAASVFLFALIGIPLGIMAGGRSVMAAFGLSFAIVLVLFYPFLIVGQVAAEAGALPAAPAIWAGNVVVLLIGAGLMAKVMRA